MLLICKDAQGQFQFTENSEQNNVLIDLNSIEEQLDLGKKTEYIDIFTQVFESEQFKNTQQQIKDQIEWAYNLVQNYEYRDEEPKPPQSDEGYNYENELLNQRYPDVHSTNLMLDNNIVKVRARVQLLQQTEQKNLLKAKILEQSAQKLITCKQNRYEKEISRQQYERQMQHRLQQKQLSIQEQKERHNKILQEKKGKLGKIFQVRQAQTRDLKMRIKNDYQDTIRDIYYENKKSYERVKQIEEEHSAKLSKFFLDKQVFAQKNYQRKIEDEFYRTTMKQDELDQLERQENDLLERIKKTQQIYQESSDRLQQIKSKSYRDIQNIG